MSALYTGLAIWAVISLSAGVLYAFFMYCHNTRNEMRTASQRQIERETAEIQNGKYAWWKRALEAIGWVVACLLIAGLVVPK